MGKILRSKEDKLGILEKTIKKIQNDARYEYTIPTGTTLKYAPFFSSCTLYSVETMEAVVNEGEITFEERTSAPEHHGIMTIRTGDPKKGFGRASTLFKLPNDLKERNLVTQLDRSINSCFRTSIFSFNSRIANSIGHYNGENYYGYLSPETKEEFIQEDIQFKQSRLKEIKKMLRDVTGELHHKNLFDVQGGFYSALVRKYYVDSEGSKIFTANINSSLDLYLKAIDPEGRIIQHGYSLSGNGNFKEPTYQELIDIGKRTREELFEIIKSPIQPNGVYPVLMDAENHGVLWHEVVGHSLEGHRIIPDVTGEKDSIFEGKLNELIVNPVLSVHDDPTLNHSGHYLYDDEGVKGQRITLIENGVLKNFLHSRESAGYMMYQKNMETCSNGHCRGSTGDIPVPRMSNIVIETNTPYSEEELMNGLVEVTKSMGQKYGLYFKGSIGGMTLPQDCFYETYPKEVFRIYTDGKIERVRGIYVVANPFETLQNFVAAGDTQEVFQGYCGAESGSIPCAEIAPMGLFSSIGVNKMPESNYDRIGAKMINPK